MNEGGCYGSLIKLLFFIHLIKSGEAFPKLKLQKRIRIKATFAAFGRSDTALTIAPKVSLAKFNFCPE